MSVGYVFERFPAAQTAELRLVLAHVPGDLSGIGPGICTQRPADGFADEEIAIGEVRLDVGVQQMQVRVSLERDLAGDRYPALPQVLVGAPRAHDRSQLFRMSAQHLTDQVRRLIDV